MERDRVGNNAANGLSSWCSFSQHVPGILACSPRRVRWRSGHRLGPRGLLHRL